MAVLVYLSWKIDSTTLYIWRTVIMKRFFCAALALILLIGLFPGSALAANEITETQIVRYDDGSYMEISIEMSPARIKNTVSGSKTYTFYDSENTVRWAAKLQATFAYSGAWYTCSAANCNVTIYDNSWYVISNNTVRSSNNAFTYLTMGFRTAGVTVTRPEYTIRLTCDINGNLS